MVYLKRSGIVFAVLIELIEKFL